MTRALPQPSALSGDQRRPVERARELAEAAATVETLAAYLGVSTQHPGQFFYAAYGAAMDRMRDLLASINAAGARQVGPVGDPPHAYVPAGPVEAAPYLGYCRPEIRREAFAAVLEGVELGAYDERMVEWVVSWDDPTCRTIASILWRCRLAGAAEQAARLAVTGAANAVPGSVVLSPDDADVIRQGLADASAWRAWRAEGAGCEACARLDPDRCPGHALDEQVAAGYDSLLRRLIAEGDSL